VQEIVQKNPGREGSAVLRPASAADFPEMHRVRMSVRENRLSNPALVQPGDYESILERNGRAWVAELGDRIVGFAVADIARSNVWALFVDPEAEGRGVGRRLHDTMIAWMFSTGATQVWLTTGPGTRSERFYRSAGWRHAGTEPNGEARYVMTREQWLAAASPSVI
jgi:GNAT superfamily N-acetyltransferase